MNNNRFCTQEGHNNDQVTHLCIYQECKLNNQQCCRLCIAQGIHQHGQSEYEHIRLKQNNDQVLPQLDKQDGQYKNVKSINFKNIKYKKKQIDHGDKYYAAAISNDEKYLAYGGHQIFKIFDLKEDKIIKQIKSEKAFVSCQFTSDSSQLFVANSPLLIGYDVKRNFKKTFQCEIQGYYIDTIITIKNQYLMTSVGNYKIVKIDIKRKKQLFNFENYDRIQGIDYNQKNNFVINGSWDGSLKLWHCSKLKIIIKKQQAHDVQNKICQIQFINNITNVLSLDIGCNLYKWKIDLIKYQLIKLEEYESSNNIFSFQQINQNQNLILICFDCIRILDDKGKLIIKIDHQIEYYFDDDHFGTKIRQLDNARYIIIRSKDKIIMASALN